MTHFFQLFFVIESNRQKKKKKNKIQAKFPLD
jgi:hypothetical protein